MNYQTNNRYNVVLEVATKIGFILYMLGAASCATKPLIGGVVEKGKLNLNGAYIHKVGWPDPEWSVSVIYFLYSNGIILKVGAELSNEPDLTRYSSKDFHAFLNDNDGDVTHWGALDIHGDQISFEIYPPRAFSKTVIRRGKIVNDTSFVITSLYSNSLGKSEQLEEYYFLERTNFKIDSTNRFVIPRN